MPASTRHFDVAILGGGAAGIAAAITLAQGGKSVCLLEARNRLGGRILTVHEPDFSLPIELGAELIHGRSPTTMKWLQRTGLACIDVSRARWTKHGEELVQGNALFDAMKRGLESMRPPARDLPFAEFLDVRARGKLSPRVREFARALVEGFDAADADRVSTLQTLEGWTGGAAADAPTFRPLGGYGTLIERMSTLLDRERVELRLNTVANHVRWSAGEVEVEATQFGQSREFSANQALVALPLGVLQVAAQDSGAIRFTPNLDAKRRPLSLLAPGPVIKVLLRFREAFWEDLHNCRYREAGFFHAPGLEFPTFWTLLPMRAPLLVAWAGGPNAARWSGQSQEYVVAAALASLKELFPGNIQLSSLLLSAHLHDWQADAFARGAYSYVLSGGSNARRSLAKPIDDTLFFAGEAADTGGEAATVAGALHSGERAAQAILRAKT